MQYLKFEIKNHIGFILLTRPQALNALNQEMVRSLRDQLQRWSCQPNVHQVLISSSNDRAFCAGGDLRALYNVYLDCHKNLPQTQEILQSYFEEEYALNLLIKTYPKPYTACLNGITMGGGLGISIHGALRIATNDLVLAMPETQIGFFTDAGATYFLSRCPGELGTYVALTSTRLNATEALYINLIDQIIGTPPQENHLEKNLSTINACFKYHSINKILKALCNHSSLWAQKIHAILLQRSPISLEKTLAALRAAKNLNFRQCMEAEYQLANFFMGQADFYEGIRAAIIDKDHQPHWSSI